MRNAALKIAKDNNLCVFALSGEKVCDFVTSVFNEPVLAIPVDDSHWTFLPFFAGWGEDSIIEYVADTLGDSFNAVLKISEKGVVL